MASPFFSIPHINSDYSPKRIRVYKAGVCIVDTTKAKLVWRHKWFPHYFFSQDELPKEHLIPTNLGTDEIKVYDLNLGEKSEKPKEVVQHYVKGPLEGLFAFKFDAVDSWFEEDEEMYDHPKDPYKRIDILQSSRHVRVEVNGVEIANTQAPRFLYETALPVRTYIPKVDCRLDLFHATSLLTSCPYKGKASYYSVKTPSGIAENVVWWYPNTTLECAPIRSYVCFYDEKVDIWLDGVKQERPVTHS
ncbi:hypothetical protein M422DRAFT_73123 [Sphaerobolus stellatus SS14]|nr:hypothetical protein M422DRAFT_73123 [Sphaerobolus stellatus SS14]